MSPRSQHSIKHSRARLKARRGFVLNKANQQELDPKHNPVVSYRKSFHISTGHDLLPELHQQLQPRRQHLRVAANERFEDPRDKNGFYNQKMDRISKNGFSALSASITICFVHLFVRLVIPPEGSKTSPSNSTHHKRAHYKTNLRLVDFQAFPTFSHNLCILKKNRGTF